MLCLAIDFTTIYCYNENAPFQKEGASFSGHARKIRHERCESAFIPGKKKVHI